MKINFDPDMLCALLKVHTSSNQEPYILEEHEKIYLDTFGLIEWWDTRKCYGTTPFARSLIDSFNKTINDTLRVEFSRS